MLDTKKQNKTKQNKQKKNPTKNKPNNQQQTKQTTATTKPQPTHQKNKQTKKNPLTTQYVERLNHIHYNWIREGGEGGSGGGGGGGILLQCRYLDMPSARDSKAVYTALTQRARQMWLLWLPQQHVAVSQGRICSDNCLCCHTESDAADQPFSHPVPVY